MIAVVRMDRTFARFEELLALIQRSFAYMDGVIDPPSSALDLDADRLENKADAEIAYAAIEADQLLGCIFLRPEPSHLYIGKLAVAPEVQGRGIGRQLLAQAEQVARCLDLSALRLETRIELAGNHARFAAWGFVRTAENRHAGFDRTTSVEMQKQLG